MSDALAVAYAERPSVGDRSFFSTLSHFDSLYLPRRVNHQTLGGTDVSRSYLFSK